MLIAERRIVLHDANDDERTVVIRLGIPVPVPPSLGLPVSAYRCPAQILGLGIDDKIFAPPGLDPFEAVYNALDVVGQQLAYRAEQLKLTNRGGRRESRSLTWIWKYEAS
jgi:hypothetical protein